MVGLFGASAEFVGDQGELGYAEVAERLRRLGIAVLHTTPYHPRSNGLVERGHQEILKAIERWLGPGRMGLWPDYLPFAVLADNLTIDRTPAELLTS